MKKDERLRCALIYGGRGHESEVSLRGKEHILPLVDNTKYNVIPIFIDKSGVWYTDGEPCVAYRGGFFCPDSGRFSAVDCAFPLLHGDYGEDGCVQGALECASIPYVGCDVRSAAVCRDKALVKMVATGIGIPTLPYITLLRREGVDYATRLCEASLSYPVFIKPTCLGSSVGVARADNTTMLRLGIERAFALSDRIIVEPYLSDKRELECGYFSTKSKEIFTNPGEILSNGIYGYEEKYLTGDVEVVVRAEICEDTCGLIREYARRLCRALGVRDLSRVDFFLSGTEIYFNEINTMPGFTESSLYAKMLSAYGYGEGALIESLIDSATARG